jgi:hypothetical protein
MSKFVLLCSAALVCATPSLASTPLAVVNVGAPAINCVFNPSCTVTVTDTIGNYPPETGYTGTPVLQSRTFDGAPGTPAAGLTAYVYRVDFTATTAATDINCATNLKIRTGPVAHLPYSPGGSADVFVTTTGGLGTIGIASAMQTGEAITFTFTTPVCPTNGVNAPGQSSFFFGIAAKGKPRNEIAKSALTYGGGIADVPARAPKH